MRTTRVPRGRFVAGRVGAVPVVLEHVAPEQVVAGPLAPSPAPSSQADLAMTAGDGGVAA